MIQQAAATFACSSGEGKDEAGVAGVGHTHHHHLHQSILISGFLLLLLFIFFASISRPRLGVSNEERAYVVQVRSPILLLLQFELVEWRKRKGRVVFDITFIHVLLVV